MGTQAQARNLDIERDFLGHENCTEILTREPPRSGARDPSRLSRRRRRRDPDQQLWRLADHARRVRHRRQGVRPQQAAPPSWRARRSPNSPHDGRTRFVIGSVGPGTRLPSLGHIAYQPLEDALTVQCAGLIAGGVDAILIETCQDPLQIKAAVNGAKRARDEAGKDTADPRPGDGRDHRHPAGRRRHRRRGDDHPRARRAGDRPQLRDRPARNGRARQMARRELAGPHLGAAQCRAARAGRRPDALPAGAGRAGAMARALRARGRRQHHRRLLRHRGARTSPRSTAMLRRIGRDRPRPVPKTRKPAWAPSVASLYGQVRAAPGERLPVDRRALQRQRLARLPPAAGEGRLGRLRRDGARAGQGRLAHARPLHRLCRARRDRRHDRGGDPHARRGQRAAGHRPRPSTRCSKPR